MIIQEGLDKLSEYIARLDLVPAYTLAMGMCFSPFSHSFIYLRIPPRLVFIQFYAVHLSRPTAHDEEWAVRASHIEISEFFPSIPTLWAFLRLPLTLRV